MSFYYCDRPATVGDSAIGHARPGAVIFGKARAARCDRVGSARGYCPRGCVIAKQIVFAVFILKSLIQRHRSGPD
jgi:hypothetical protein